MPLSQLDFSCSHQFPDLKNCGAGAGDWCVDENHNRMRGVFHVERLNAVAAQTPNAPDPVSHDDFQAAVLDSGLV